MTRPRWKQADGVDEHFEIEIRPGIFLAIHRVEGEERWQGALFDAGAEELPFLTFALTRKSVRGAKAEAVDRAAKGLFKLVEALDRVKAAA